MSIIYFIVLIGVLIFVHELGHFVFAKAFDVRVDRFSIGIGPKIVGFEYGETQYVICWLPLGGYVQMHGHNFESMENVDEEDRDRALMGKPVWQRSLIAFAGPLFNFVLPVVIYFVVTLSQAGAPPAVVGQVLPETPAAEAGIQSGDRIVSIDGYSVDYWHDITEHVESAYNRSVEIVIERDGERKEFAVSPEKKTSTDFLGLNSRTYGMLGVHLGTHGPTIAVSDPDGVGARAGLEHFDRIIAIDGEKVRTFHDIRSGIRDSEGRPVELVVLKRRPIDVSYAQFFGQEARTVTVEPTRRNGTWTIGIEPAEMYVTEVDDDSPARRAGLQSGDRIVALDGRHYGNWKMMVDRIQNDIYEKIRDDGSGEDVEQSYELTYERNDTEHSTELTPAVIEYKGESKQKRYRIYVGWGNLSDLVMPEDEPFPFFERAAYGAERGVEKTWEVGHMMVMGLVRMMQGRVSLDTVGGPIMIGELAAQAGRAGPEYFLQMMALISINLGIINLLPIPVLDGGHLMFYAIEAVRRRPLSFRTRQIATYIGFAIIVLLMLLAFKNDIERNWQDFVEWLNSL